MTVKQAVGLAVAALVGVSTGTAQGRGWSPPKCDIRPGHFLVNSGVLYLQNATKTRFDDQRAKDLADALRVLTQAVTSGSQDKNPAAWYYLGRYYQMVTDLPGADSTFRKAEALAPTCKEDIAVWRRQMWTDPYNKGVQAYNAGQSDSAIAYFRRANVIYFGEPAGHSAIATLFANSGLVDSAALYYGRAAQAAAVDTVKYARERREALYNQGAVLHQAKRWDDALAIFRAYLAAYPNDPQAMAGVASAHAARGNNDSATAMYLKILDRADSVAPEQLFTAGVAIFNSAPPLPDTATAGTACRTEERAKRPPPTPRQVTTRCDQKTREMVRARDEASAGTYRIAIRAFEAGLARNPYYRDALFNLTNTHLILQDSVNMLSAAQRLVAVDPMSRGSLRLLAAAWQFKRNTDSTLRYLTVADSLLPVEVSVTNFAPQEQNAALHGLVTNFHARPSTALKLTVEFLDTKGVVVATQTVDVTAIEPGSSQVFQTSAIGAGIVAWRYKQG